MLQLQPPKLCKVVTGWQGLIAASLASVSEGPCLKGMRCRKIWYRIHKKWYRNIPSILLCPLRMYTTTFMHTSAHNTHIYSCTNMHKKRKSTTKEPTKYIFKVKFKKWSASSLLNLWWAPKSSYQLDRRVLATEETITIMHYFVLFILLRTVRMMM